LGFASYSYVWSRVNAGYELERTVWSEEDFASMGWHDCWIHALSFTAAGELVFDLDYILELVESEQGETYYRFWISPATLIVRDVDEVVFDLDAEWTGWQIFDFSREEKSGKKQLWKLECIEGVISFRAEGFEQFVRSAPILCDEQKLDLDEREGISFSQQYENGGSD
jgi:hypothetical protein